METYYSKDAYAVTWGDTELETAVIDFIENDYDEEVKVGDTITVFKGQLKAEAPEYYLPNLAKITLDRAYDDENESCGNWLSGEAGIKLQDEFKAWFSEWCKRNDEMPMFGAIINIKPVQVLIKALDENGPLEFEEIKEK